MNTGQCSCTIVVCLVFCTALPLSSPRIREFRLFVQYQSLALAYQVSTNNFGFFFFPDIHQATPPIAPPAL